MAYSPKFRSRSKSTTNSPETTPLKQINNDSATEHSEHSQSEETANIANGSPIENSTETAIDADIAEFIPTPPDGGWGWVIVIASFMNQLILDGIVFAFGAFMLHYKEYFHSSAAATSALMSLLLGCYMLSGENVSCISNRWIWITTNDDRQT